MFHPGEVWLDTAGQPIQAHGGGILYQDGTYYWFGENKDNPTHHGRADVVGISCYSSTDLYNWRNEGIVLPAVPDDHSHDLHPSKAAERPKVIYNQQTRTYVMWLHIDSADYTYARTGVATSSTPTGPYHYQGSFRPCDADSRDMTLFQNHDGSAYVVFASSWNSVVLIARLTDDYLHTTATFTTIPNYPRESPAALHHKDRYFLITSACTGWDPNPADYAVAPSMYGPWESKGNPCVGPDAETTFHSQNTYILPVAGKKDAFILLADRWNSKDLRDSRYVWLPLSINGDQLSVSWHDQWDLSIFDK